MNGQFWPDGDDLYHSWISTPTLLVYGRHDKLVSLQEEEEMLKVLKDYVIACNICQLYFSTTFVKLHSYCIGLGFPLSCSFYLFLCPYI